MIRRPPRSPLFPPTTLSHSLLLISRAAGIVLLRMTPPIEVIYAKESLGVGDSGFGALLTPWGLGMVAGSLLFARERRRSLLWLIGASTLVQAVAYLGMGVAPGLAVACLASALGGIGNGVSWVAVVTAAQEATDERYQARVA